MFRPFAKPAAKQVIKTSDALTIVDMMTSVTEPGGTATLAAIDGYRWRVKPVRQDVPTLKAADL